VLPETRATPALKAALAAAPLSSDNYTYQVRQIRHFAYEVAYLYLSISSGKEHNAP
jgi:hypothetical protein